MSVEQLIQISYSKICPRDIHGKSTFKHSLTEQNDVCLLDFTLSCQYVILQYLFILQCLEDLLLSDLRNVWFQHDGASPHKVSSVQHYIRDTFQQQAIGYGGCVEWHPRSPDLNPLDFFLWGNIKQRVCATPPPTLQELRNRITDACASVSPVMLYNVQREVQSRVQMCIVAEGHHFEHDR
ncbi:hypothetical protein AVEN_5208-1 [Araneus ventricosus]|uniref:Tc1-like transposase DDE domain-containing protein n=1 Tax=Araneus ventricosus TaxID=182803 RepID=A0A4Y2G389_ARAVE|nr:hypothetical protein AVEN_5208-1 [Araneus ventricosus]